MTTAYLVPILIITPPKSGIHNSIVDLVSQIKAKNIAFYNFTFSSVTFSLTVLFIWLEIGTWEVRFYSVALGTILHTLYLIFVAYREEWLALKFSIAQLKTSLKYSIPLMPNAAAGWVAMFSDRFILSQYGVLDEVGVYSIAAQLALVLYMANDA